MKLRVSLLPLLIFSLVLQTSALKPKKYYKPRRDLFYMRIHVVPKKINAPAVQVEVKDNIEYYGNTKGAQGVVAVLSLNGEVYTLREGEILGKRYRVLKIYSDKVILLDQKKDKKITVKLKEG